MTFADQPSPELQSRSEVSRVLDAEPDLGRATFAFERNGTVRQALAQAAEKLNSIQQVQEGIVMLLRSPRVDYALDKTMEGEKESATKVTFPPQMSITNDLRNNSPSQVTPQSKKHQVSAPGSTQKEEAEAFPRSHQVQSSTSLEGTGENDPREELEQTNGTIGRQTIHKALEDNAQSAFGFSRSRGLQESFDQVAMDSATSVISSSLQSSAQTITATNPKRAFPITIHILVACFGVISGLLVPVIDMSALITNKNIGIHGSQMVKTTGMDSLKDGVTSEKELTLITLPVLQLPDDPSQQGNKNALAVVIAPLRSFLNNIDMGPHNMALKLAQSFDFYSNGTENVFMKLSFFLLAAIGGVAFALAIISIVLLPAKKSLVERNSPNNPRGNRRSKNK